MLLTFVSKLISLPYFGALDDDELVIVVFGSSEIVIDGVESKMVAFSGSAEDEIDDGRFVVLTIADPRLMVNNRSCDSHIFLPIFI